MREGSKNGLLGGEMDVEEVLQVEANDDAQVAIFSFLSDSAASRGLAIIYCNFLSGWLDVGGRDWLGDEFVAVVAGLTKRLFQKKIHEEPFTSGVRSTTDLTMCHFLLL